MGILKGGLSVRRYRAGAEPPEGFRDLYTAALEENAFREPLTATNKEQRVGWVQVHNLLDTSFLDTNRWLYNQYAVFALRIDKKVIPAKYFQAHLQKRVQTWCEGQKRERCPAAVKQELKEALELEMLQKTLPRVAIYEVAWNIAEGWVVFHNQSEVPNDTFRKLFHRTFGMALMPHDALDFVADRPEQVEALLASGASDLRTEAA
jgi:DNA recombination-dependent growth factor C